MKPESGGGFRGGRGRGGQRHSFGGEKKIDGDESRGGGRGGRFSERGMVDCIFADVAQPDQSRIVGVNAEYYLKNGGHTVISIKASCIDSVAAPEVVFAKEVDTLRKLQFTPREQVTLEPFERGHAMVTAQYRAPKKVKNEQQ
ncbi:unnamed protein product [Heterobilharzia americana]|nr:unnamed protein product [Heterobilharzia americana]